VKRQPQRAQVPKSMPHRIALWLLLLALLYTAVRPVTLRLPGLDVHVGTMPSRMAAQDFGIKKTGFSVNAYGPSVNCGARIGSYTYAVALIRQR
jgi:hypothetical protein